MQFEETAAHRGWRIEAFAIMATHLHLVVGAADETSSDDIMRVLKAYGSRALNRLEGTRDRTWWTAHGSRRLLADEAALAAVIDYVKRQAAPLLIWSRDEQCPPGCGGVR
jgi:REP element-mobilizing transposase RayT